MRLLLSRGGADPGSKLRRAAWKPFGGSFSLSIGRQEAWFDLSEVATDIGRARAKNLRGPVGLWACERREQFKCYSLTFFARDLRTLS
jgi:hypothetical protein